jgi:hypothetical protein
MGGNAEKNMFIKSMVIEGLNGDVRICREDGGAVVTANDEVLCRVGMTEAADARYAKARQVAKVVCGTDRRGEPCATSSMVHQAMTEIDRSARC